MDILTARNAAVKKLYAFQLKLGGDEIEPADLKDFWTAFFEFDQAVKDALLEPRILEMHQETPQYFEHNERVERVEQQDLVLRPSDNWLELENGDFLNIDKIDYLSKEKNTILFSNGKWSKTNVISEKDVKKIRYILQTKRFK